MGAIKVLVLYDYFSPAFKAGGPIQSLQNLTDQLGAIFDFSVFSGAFDKGEKSVLAQVTRNTWNKRENGLKVFYWVPSVFRPGPLVKAVSDHREGVVYINGLYSVYFSMLPLLLKAHRFVLAPRGMLHAGALSQKAFKKRVYLLFFKLLHWHRKVVFHATDAAEARYIQQAFGPQVRIIVAPNIPRFTGRQAGVTKSRGSLKLVSIALLSAMKNIDLVLGALAQCTAEIDYSIYGPVKDPRYWERCKAILPTLPGNIRVHYRGEIEPAQVPAALASSHVFVLPSKSENFGHALFESLSAARPVITSHQTPWNDLASQKAGMNVATEGVESLASAIRFFADMDSETYTAYCDGAYAVATGFMEKADFNRAYQLLFSDK